jgi:hypothetical protein
MQQHLAVKMATSAYHGAAMTGRAWRDQARCSKEGVPLSKMFAEGADAQRKVARAVCPYCPAKVDCLVEALAMPYMPDGVWGGTTFQERARMVSRALRGRCRNCGDRVASDQRYCVVCEKAASWRSLGTAAVVVEVCALTTGLGTASALKHVWRVTTSGTSAGLPSLAPTTPPTGSGCESSGRGCPVRGGICRMACVHGRCAASR